MRVLSRAATSGGTVIVLADVRREQEGAAGRVLARRIQRAVRDVGGTPAPTLEDAAASVHSVRHRPLARKLEREVRAAISQGASPELLLHALVEYVEALVPVAARRIAPSARRVAA